MMKREKEFLVVLRVRGEGRFSQTRPLRRVSTNTDLGSLFPCVSTNSSLFFPSRVPRSFSCSLSRSLLNRSTARGVGGFQGEVGWRSHTLVGIAVGWRACEVGEMLGRAVAQRALLSQVRASS